MTCVARELTNEGGPNHAIADGNVRRALWAPHSISPRASLPLARSGDLQRESLTGRPSETRGASSQILAIVGRAITSGSCAKSHEDKIAHEDACHQHPEDADKPDYMNVERGALEFPERDPTILFVPCQVSPLDFPGISYERKTSAEEN
jgi:hypothetical protein